MPEDEERDDEAIQSLSKEQLTRLTQPDVAVATLIRAWLALDYENQMMYDAIQILTVEERIAFTRELLRSLHRVELLQGIQRLIELVGDDIDEDYTASIEIDLKIDRERAESQVGEDIEALQVFHRFLIRTAGKAETTMLKLQDILKTGNS